MTDTETTTITAEDVAPIATALPELVAKAPLSEPTVVQAAPVPDPQVAYAIYDGATGQVRLTGHMPYSMLALQKRTSAEGIVLEWLNDTIQYVDVSTENHVGKARPVLVGFDKLAIKADAADTATLNLPLPATVIVDGVSHIAPAGPLTFTVDSPGAYNFHITGMFPYQDFEAVVTAS